MSKCPSCYEPIRRGETVCPCGWQAKGGRRTSTTGHTHACEYCKRELFYPSKASGKPRANHIIGRSKNEGYICGECYEHPPNPELSAMDQEAITWANEHRGDGWGVLMRVAGDTVGHNAGRELLAALKVEARKHGGMLAKLPYDPSRRYDIEAAA